MAQFFKIGIIKIILDIKVKFVNCCSQMQMFDIKATNPSPIKCLHLSINNCAIDIVEDVYIYVFFILL